MENLIILQKLYSIKNLLIDSNEIEIINKLISKRKININVDFEYTNKEFKGSQNVFVNILKRIYKEPDPWIMDEKKEKYISLNQKLFDKMEKFDYESYEIIKKYSLLRIKNNKNKNQLSRVNSILIQNIFEQEINNLIKKTYKK